MRANEFTAGQGITISVPVNITIPHTLFHPEPTPVVQEPASQSMQSGTDEDKPSPNGTTASGNDQEPQGLFLPPLQQKQELLKKAVGVKNIYDDGRPDDQFEQEKTQELEDLKSKQQDIVARIKQLSGTPTAAIQELSNDDVFDD